MTRCEQTVLSQTSLPKRLGLSETSDISTMNLGKFGLGWPAGPFIFDQRTNHGDATQVRDLHVSLGGRACFCRSDHGLRFCKPEDWP